MKWVLIIGALWGLSIVFFLALFKAASRGDRMLEDMRDELNKDDLEAK